VVKELDAAKTTILVQAYSFTSAPIAKALVEAHKRGVDVRVILDRSQRTEKYSSADFVAHAGIPTWIDAQHAIAHNKVMVIDGGTVLDRGSSSDWRCHCGLLGGGGLHLFREMERDITSSKTARTLGRFAGLGLQCLHSNTSGE
jgi:hypothetical protein